MILQQNGDAASSPPMREKTCSPTAAETCAVNSNIAARPNLSFKLRSRDPNRRVVKTKNQTVDISPSDMKENRNHSSWDTPSFEHNGGESKEEQENMQRDWARNLQKCLLEAEAELQKSRKAAEVREQEFLAASVELARLRELVSTQNQRIAELEWNLDQTKPLIVGKNSTTDTKINPTIIANVFSPPPPRTPPSGISANTSCSNGDNADSESNDMASLEGLSISEIKKVVHSAAETLRRVEAQYEKEKRRRRALEKENDELHHQLKLTHQKEGKKKHHGDSCHSCNNETHMHVMNFLQGALQQFLIDAAEVQERVKMPGSHCTNVQS
ncbi:uncharacterized protein TM35_000162130 [Trypanosoma theileri]|uniref:Uncharacterized protein n=1 Tax=Trypanosoma theileri TaxID=67003 RepID=A0A1X0NV68_9TRYP|nr:uncharacterized protein TM35_000162130 [Trypanosoma theileri]ORC88575.1 hypothetical protein TM35_000162130 [Trypanosoma theileri]